MACGCTTGDGNGAPILTGTLDPSFSSASASPANSAEESIFSSTALATPRARFWEAAAVIGFLVIVSWVVYKSEKKSE